MESNVDLVKDYAETGDAKMNELTEKTNEELESLLLDLCGKLTLDNKDIELLRAVEDERERRFKFEKVGAK